MVYCCQLGVKQNSVTKSICQLDAPEVSIAIQQGGVLQSRTGSCFYLVGSSICKAHVHDNTSKLHRDAVAKMLPSGVVGKHPGLVGPKLP